MPIPKYTARTTLAAEIARVDRQRFNEAVADGFYTCAPKTVRGKVRRFEVNDIVTLWVYGRLLNKGMSQRVAGRSACELHALLVQFPETERAVQVTNSFGSHVWFRPEDFDFDSTHMGGADIEDFHVWSLKNKRNQFIAELREEARTLGRDEEDEDE